MLFQISIQVKGQFRAEKSRLGSWPKFSLQRYNNLPKFHQHRITKLRQNERKSYGIAAAPLVINVIKSSLFKTFMHFCASKTFPKSNNTAAAARP